MMLLGISLVRIWGSALSVSDIFKDRRAVSIIKRWGEGPRPSGAQSGRSGNPTAALSKGIAPNSGAPNKGFRERAEAPPPCFRPHRRGNVERKRKGGGAARSISQ
ncbi:hypothetical protein NDU88_005489 [Pleurodeles waltl]|uniref:Uncharacterized protein n=1 Tax=Pleurodeles waltl TaxID=8319 RepID=A0AAV7TCQ7_PLEWA|nr:hypothetical protein NDU88_005489 [Pleurodeles waltl]